MALLLTTSPLLGAALAAEEGQILGWGTTVILSDDDLSGLVAVAGGGAHSLGLKADGSIVAWGYNDYGLCEVPVPNSGFVAIAAGREHSLGLKADGSIVAWGRNS
jgi:alpha-tubulin suppressor-like RCC1 family protein